MSAARIAVCLFVIALASGCYRHHTWLEPNDGGLVVPAPDAGPPAACTSRCSAPRLLAEAMTMPLQPVRVGLIDLATVNDTTALLVAEGDEPIGHHDHVLYVRSPGETVLRPSAQGGGVSIRPVMSGILVARPSTFLAAFLVMRDFDDELWAGLRLAEWSLEGELLRSDDVGELAFLVDTGCRAATSLECNVRASFRQEGEDGVLVTIVAPPYLHRMHVDLAAWSVSDLAPLPVPEERRVGEPVSTLATAGHRFASIGGPAPWLRPRPSVLLGFDERGRRTVEQEIPGASYNPPALLATLEEQPTLWRYVTDASRPLDSAVHGWRLTADGLGDGPDWTITTGMGYRPTSLEILEGSDGRRGTVLWVAPDPRDADRGATLSMLRLRPDFAACERLTPATVAQFPWRLNEIGPALTAAADEDGILTAVLGRELVGQFPLVLLRTPNCE